MSHLLPSRPAVLRERLADICVTRMSAASSTVPGGYEEAGMAAGRGGQFPIADERSVDETVAWLERAGHEVIWSAPDLAVRRCVPSSPAGGER